MSRDAHGGGRRAIMVIATLLAIGLGAYAYFLFAPAVRELVAERKAAELPPPPPAKPAGLPAPPQVTPPGVDAATSAEPIPLVLASVIPGRNALEGAASIGTSAENAQVYAAGALLPNGSRLLEVHNDHVLLAQGAGRAKLYLDGRPTGFSLPDSALSTRQTLEHRLLYVGGSAEERKEITPEPAFSLATVVRTQPVFEDGRFRGISLEAGGNAALFAALGFKSGDVVVALDGAPVKSASQAEDLLGALDSGGAIPVTIQREGRLEYLNVEAEAARRAPAPEPTRPEPNMANR